MAEVKARDKIKQYFAKGKDSVEIVLAGKMSTGKSSLVNSLVGKQVAKEGHKALTETAKIVCYTKAVAIPSDILKKTINVMLWDTPGLGNLFGDDEATAKETAGKCKETDLVVYCLDIRGRLAKDDVAGIKLLTEAVGQQMWNHAVFVLTFANEFKANDGQDAAIELGDRISAWTDAIKHLMKKNLNFPHKIADNITIIPTGYRHDQPPGIDDWFSPFWVASFAKIKPIAQPALLGINTERLSGEESASKDHQGEASEEPHEMPIRFSAGTGALVGLVGSAIGAASSGVGYVGKVILDSIFGKR